MHFTYQPVTEDQFTYAYECLPPYSIKSNTMKKIREDIKDSIGLCFMNSEPVRHVDGRPTYNCYIEVYKDGISQYLQIKDDIPNL